ncbi:hypothetical protein DW986_05285 [Parabacteroides merdae]|jgi:hypothetical protein|uniref:Uncharacterized protein n=1 Tax=Parabacteroides merdae TaxID=46503 RepID=A0A3R5ZSS4_9BACT|nr:hypothetical protein DW986_05285 [Parabacteroides merdae]
MCTTTPKTNNTYIGLEIQRVALVDLRRCFEAIVKVWFIKTGGAIEKLFADKQKKCCYGWDFSLMSCSI